VVLGGGAWLGGGQGRRVYHLVAAFLWWALLRDGAASFVVGDAACVVLDIEDCWWGWSKCAGSGLHSGGRGGAVSCSGKSPAWHFWFWWLAWLGLGGPRCVVVAVLMASSLLILRRKIVTPSALSESSARPLAGAGNDDISWC
jgi:hypothetical protein